jgi:hypothetical protein
VEKGKEETKITQEKKKKHKKRGGKALFERENETAKKMVEIK